MRKVYLPKLFIILLSIYFSNTLYSQNYPADQGSFITGGEFLFNSDGGDLFENKDGDRITRLSLELPFSYFIVPGFAAGGAFMYGSTSQGDHSSTEWGIGPSLTYYINVNNPLTKSLGAVYPFLRVLFLYSNTKNESASNETSFSGTLLEFSGGVALLITESVALYGVAGYQLLNFSPDEGDSISGNRVKVGLGFAIFIY